MTDNVLAKWKRTNIDIQNTTKKTKDWATRTLLKTRYERGCSGTVGSSCSAGGTHRVSIVTETLLIILLYRFPWNIRDFRVKNSLSLREIVIITVVFLSSECKSSYIIIWFSNMTSFFRFVDKRAIYRWYNLISTCAVWLTFPS